MTDERAQREAFEKWMQEEWPSIRLDYDDQTQQYLSMHADRMQAAYSAGLAAQPSAKGKSVEAYWDECFPKMVDEAGACEFAANYASELQYQLAAASEREKRLREVLHRIRDRFKNEDHRAGNESFDEGRSGLAWAMYADAKAALKE